jgi:hypothetical protein
LLVGLLSLAIFALTVVSGAVPALGATGDPAFFGRNLVVNGNAEANRGSDDETVVVRPSDWKTSGQFGVFQYGGIFGFPDRNVPGPPDRGRNFFTGGDAAISTATQTIDVAPIAATIDAGRVRYVLSAWLGGYDAQSDDATVDAFFLGGPSHALGSARLGPVTSADRGERTSLVARSHAGTVPAGTRAVRIVLTAKRIVGTSNDGYIDDVALVLARSS